MPSPPWFISSSPESFKQKLYHVLLFQMKKPSFWYWWAGKCLKTNTLGKRKLEHLPILRCEHSTTTSFKLAMGHWMQSWEERCISPWSSQRAQELTLVCHWLPRRATAGPRSYAWSIPEPTYHLIIEQSHNWPSESFHLTKQKCVSLCKAGQKVVVGGPQLGGDSQPQRQREECLQCLVDWSPWVLELLYHMKHQFSAWGED